MVYLQGTHCFFSPRVRIQSTSTSITPRPKYGTRTIHPLVASRISGTAEMCSGVQIQIRVLLYGDTKMRPEAEYGINAFFAVC